MLHVDATRLQPVEKEMRLYRATWCQCPTAHNTTQVTFIEAPSMEDARVVLKDYVERTHHIEWFVLKDIGEYAPPLPSQGRVVEGPR